MKSDLVLKDKEDVFLIYKIKDELAVMFIIKDNNIYDISILSAGKSTQYFFI